MAGVIWPAEADTGNWDPTVERIGLSKVIARKLERVRAITAYCALCGLPAPCTSRLS